MATSGTTTRTTDVAIIGGGAVGTAVAWRCAQRGLSVTCVDPNPHRGAWRTAAGMLAPVTELHYAETELLGLNLAAVAGYPAVAAELAESTGIDVGYRPTGALSVAWDAADLAALRDLHAFGASLGMAAELLTGREIRKLEPSLAAGVPGGLYAAGDHRVDPRALHEAMTTAASRAGAAFITASAEVLIDGDRAVGVRLDDGRSVHAAVTVLAAGAWSGMVAGLPAPAAPHTRPVRGQTLRLSGCAAPSRIVRGSVAGSPVYLVPRGDGRVIVGATSEETGFALTARAGAVYELLRDAQTLLPELAEATLDEVCTGLRPGSPDNAPVIGPSGVDGLLHATGHYRNGILLAPITADAIASLIVDGRLPDRFAPFRPDRLQERVST